jgi:hypothetical protein
MIVTKPYNRARAVEYAQRWALSRNPLFYDFTGGGGNCTNFVSQCLLAGSLVMNPTETFGWYYVDVNNRAPSWTGVREFYEFLCGIGDFSPKDKRQGPFADDVARELVEIGDVVQLSNMRGQFYHSLIVSGFENGDILVSAQSNDALDRPLSSYNYATARFLHVRGVNIEVLDIENNFDNLLNGTELPPKNQIYLPIPKEMN